MKARRQVFCSFVICIGIVSLDGLALSQQKRKRPQRSKPVATSGTPAATATKNLTRARAADLIRIHPSFKTTTYSDIPVGTFWYDWRSIKRLVETNIQPLVDNGIVTFKETGGKYSVWYHQYVVEITQEGEAEAKGWVSGTEREWVLTYQGPTGISSPNVTLFHIPVAERRLIQVTGIAVEPGGKSARVEFTWQWVPTTHGKFLPNKVPSDEAHGGAVECQLYDDGWRMGQMFIGFPFFS